MCCFCAVCVFCVCVSAVCVCVLCVLCCYICVLCVFCVWNSPNLAQIVSACAARLLCACAAMFVCCVCYVWVFCVCVCMLSVCVCIVCPIVKHSPNWLSRYTLGDTYLCCFSCVLFVCIISTGSDEGSTPTLRVCVYAVCVVVLCVLAWNSPNWLISQAPVQHVCCACGLLCVCNVFGALSVFCACEYVVCVCVCAVCLSVEQLQLADTNQIRLCQPCDVCVCCTSY